MHSSFKITYAAHTNSCTFLLDAEGICRKIVPNPALGRTQKGREALAAANRCIGAQYVASLDGSLPGLLSEMPRVGIPMLFARVDSRGRVSLVRTGVVTRFENGHAEAPFADHPPSVSVETSAPHIPPSKNGSKSQRERFRRGQPDAPEYSDDDETLERKAPQGRAAVVDLAAPTLRRPPKASSAADPRARGEREASVSRLRERPRPPEPSRTPRATSLFSAPQPEVGRRSNGR